MGTCCSSPQQQEFADVTKDPQKNPYVVQGQNQPSNDRPDTDPRGLRQRNGYQTPQQPQQPHQPAPSLWVTKETPNVREFYTFGKILGKGQFGTTRLAIDKRTGAKLACKSIAKRKLISKEDIADVRREIQIMYHLAGHPNVVTLSGSYEDAHHVHLVMELCSGGELFDRILQRGHYTEKDAASLIRTIVMVVAHCHAMGVIHRDLKPENFLMADEAANSLVKATDFGLSVFFKPGQEFTDIVGSAYYVAPEVLKRRYSKEADIWSCGVILYILLSGVPPFFGRTESEIFEAVMQGKIDFVTKPWPEISEAAKDCVRRMLVRDPRKRATAEQVLQHEWMRPGGAASDKPIEPEVLKRIRGFAAKNALQKEVLKIIAAALPEEEIVGLRALFDAMDTDKSGTITVDELRDGLRRQGLRLPETELQRIMENTDTDGDGTIDYQEFLAATIHLNKLDREEDLYKAFQHFDADGSGYITLDELEMALAKSLAEEEDKLEKIEEILAEADTDGDGQIDYGEFCALMRGGPEDYLKAATLMRKQ